MLANGANLAFTKSAFDAVRGYEGNDGLPSGDDVFLLHKIKQLRPKNVRYLKHENVWVTTSSKKTLNGFLQQRVRWAGKASAYNDTLSIIVSFLVFFTNLFFLIGLAIWRQQKGDEADEMIESFTSSVEDAGDKVTSIGSKKDVEEAKEEIAGAIEEVQDEADN